MKEVIDAINAAIEAAKAQPWSYEMSIAVTELETALLWAERLARVTEEVSDND